MARAPNPGDSHWGWVDGCSQYLFFHLVLGWGGWGYLFRKGLWSLQPGLQGWALVVSPKEEKGKIFKLTFGDVGWGWGVIRFEGSWKWGVGGTWSQK